MKFGLEGSLNQDKHFQHIFDSIHYNETCIYLVLDMYHFWPS